MFYESGHGEENNSFEQNVPNGEGEQRQEGAGGVEPQQPAPVRSEYYAEMRNPETQYTASEPQQTPSFQQAPPQKPGKSKKTLRVIAISLACVIVVGVLSGALGYIGGRLAGDTDNSGGIVSAVTDKTVTTYTDPDAETISATDIYYNYSNAVVGISGEVNSVNIFGQSTAAAVSGTGFIISEDGYILTNGHVVNDVSQIKVMTYDNKTYDAQVVGIDTVNDIAVLKIDATGLDTVVIGTTDDVKVGDSICVIGNPLGELTYTLTKGIVSALDREINIDGNPLNMFQIDAAVNAGNSGGPVFNMSGQVVGIVTAKYSTSGVEGLGFAIPIEDAMDVANDLITYGYVKGRPAFGITYDSSYSDYAAYYHMQAGVYVTSVNAGSCAEKAGIKAGDVITALDGQAVTDSSDLISLKNNYKAGDTAKVTVYRDGSFVDLTIIFDEAVSQTSQSNTVTD